MKLKVKILICLIIMSIIPISIVGLFFDYGTKKLVNDKVGDFFTQLVTSNGEYIELQVKQLENAINSIVVNDLIKEELVEYGQQLPLERVDAWTKVGRVTRSTFALNKGIRSIIYCVDNGKVEVFGEQRINENEEDEIRYKSFFEDYFQQEYLQEKKKVVGYHLKWHFGVKGQTERAFIMKEIIDLSKAKSVGIVIFAIDTDIFRKTINETKTGNGEIVFLLNEKDEYIIVDQKEKMGQKCEEPFLEDMVNEKGILVDNGYLLAYHKLYNGYKLVSRVPIRNLTSDLLDLRILTFIIAICCVTLAVIISIIFSNYVGKKFRYLISFMKQVQEGDFSVSNERIKNVKDEFDVIFNYFFKMVFKLNNLINKTYIQEIEKKESELKALQYQINPHFLFNTLEIIRSMSKIYKCDEIGVVSTKLGELFRYNMNREGCDLISIREELNHIKNYVYIQNMHYNGEINLFCDIEEEFNEFLILRFIMQPIVENIINHGFKPRGGSGCIEINTYIEADDLYIEIVDDGIGIDNMNLQTINESINNPLRTKNANQVGLGLRNVNQRLKLAFGEEYGLEINSDEKGTTVLIKLPCKEGEDAI